MTRLVISSAAEIDFTAALTWYAAQSEETAFRFEAEFERVLDLIFEGPHRYPRIDDRHRFCLMRHFPFHIIYRESEDQVIIVAVAHGNRDPGFWSGR